MTKPSAGSQSDAPKMHVYDRRNLTYANSFDNPLKQRVIRAIEWVTGKITIGRLVRRFEKGGPVHGHALWGAVLDIMGINIETPAAQLQNIPKEGPVVLVANHPHGLVDGMVLAEMIGRVRSDYRILTRSLLTVIDEDAARFMIPVPFPHDPEAQRKMVDMRKEAMAFLEQGGLVALFPSGVIATSDTMFGPVIESEWNLFTAKMIRTSGAAIVPCYFPGANSRWYQVANRISATLRQGLLLREVVHALNKPQKPIIGPPIPQNEVDARIGNQRDFVAWLRTYTLGLGNVPTDQRVGTGTSPR